MIQAVNFMDMDFLSDAIFSELDRSDYIEGIDNEAIDFGHLEQFMQIEATAENCNSQNRVNPLGCDLKTEAYTVQQQNNSIDGNTYLSDRINHSTPIATPLLNVIGHGAAKMPDSPPDSSSEPPYSPLQDAHGLSLTTRDITNALPSMQQSALLQEMRLLPQYTLPHQISQQHHTYAQRHAAQTPQSMQHSLNTSPPASPQQTPTSDAICIKHETGLVMEPPMVPQQLSQSHTSIVDNHNDSNNIHGVEPNSQQMFLNQSNINSNHAVQSENNNFSIYSAYNYPTAIITDDIHPVATTPSGAHSFINDIPRVQLIGTSQANHTQSNKGSVPTTPTHLSASRKRKLSTQLDSSDYVVKSDPAPPPYPSNSAMSGVLSPENHQQPPESPDSINLPTHSVASLSPTLSAANSNADSSLDGNNLNASGSSDCSDANALTTCIRFSPFQPQSWHKLCDQSLQEVSVVYYRVDADKGFNFSVSDDAFVCQKKNHFQITCHARLQGDAKFVKTASGLEKINSFHLHFYGVKLEAPNQTIRVEQSQSDRSKKPFYPVPIDLKSHIVSKITVGRLHFSETTNNNMRKKGRPNPEQRYFQLVVGLHVHTISGNFPIISQGSERIIVRASNPGQFETDVELCWQRGLTQDSIFHAGRVGINTDRPDESLVVHGNLKVSGHIVQPSDSRAKEEINELDTSVQLRNMQKIRVVRYRYAPEFAVHSGLKSSNESDTDEIIDTGVIAQEVREVIPDAVQEAGSIVLPNGNVIENFLLVNKDRILMENIGAVKELCKVTGSLENRIVDLERNNRMQRPREFEERCKLFRKSVNGNTGYEICSNKFLQIVILFLIILMAACLAAVSTLYFVEHNKQSYNYKQLERLQFHSNGHLLGHDSVLFNEQEGYIVQVHNILSRNKTAHNIPTFLNPNHTSSAHPHRELTYNESNELFSINGRNDELTVVMEKPLVSLQSLHPRKEGYKVTTTAPALRANKTISSKNKSKWPQAQVIPKLIASFQNSRTTNAYILSPLSTAAEAKADEFPHINETSSEKVAGAILLAHDFDNNSIDSDAQHINKKTVSSKASSAHSSSSYESGLSDIEESIEPIANSSSRTINIIPATTIAEYSLKSTQIVPKTVSPPSTNVYLTTNKVTIDGLQTNYSLELPPASNKSQGRLENTLENADSIDLQNLSNINESADNPTTALFGFDFDIGHESSLGRRSISKWDGVLAQNKVVHLNVFGTPIHCTQKRSIEDISDCQSSCSEEANRSNLAKLSNPKDEAVNEKLNENYQHIIDVNLSGSEDVIKAVEAYPTPNATAHGNKKSSESLKSLSVQHFGEADALEHTYNFEEQLESEQKSIEDSNLSQISQFDASSAGRKDSSIVCWQINGFVVASTFNQTIGLESVCPNNRKSLNVSYTLPLSKFFKEPKIQIHLRSSVPLFWTICKSRGYSKDNENFFISDHSNNDAVLQKQSNVSVLLLNVPSHGYFLQKVTLRATTDSKTENVCEENTDETNTLLQYNFSIVRNCD